jgi:hypothetical protein
MKKTLLLTSFAALAMAGTAHSQPLIAVDFNTAASPVETGFENFDVENATVGVDGEVAQTFGDYTITFFPNFNDVQVRDRNAFGTIEPGYDYTELVQDFVVQFEHTNDPNPATTSPDGTAFTISGLDANTSYNIRIWAMAKSFNDGMEQVLWDMNASGGPQVIGNTIINSTSSTSPADNNVFSTFGEAVTDASGVLDIGYVATSGNGSINGLELIPEPRTFALIAGLLGLGLVILRRRRS